MNRLWKEMQWFLRQKIYVIALAITAMCSYGFAIVSPGMGIDDTATELYFADGLAVVMGRWVIFLINKILNLAAYAPFLADLAGALLLMLAAVLMCVLLRRMFGERLSVWGYAVFSCVFVSNPIISEVYVYYLHNGIGIGYVLTAGALLLFESMQQCRGKKRIPYLIGGMLLVWLAIGCYESFMIVYLLGCCMILFCNGMTDNRRKEGPTFRYLLKNLGFVALVAGGSMALRQVMIALVTAVFGLQDMVGLMEQRNLTEMLVLFNGREGFDNLLMLAKRFWVVYHVNALVYLPVTGYVLAGAVFGVASIVLAVRKRNLWYPVLFLAMEIVPFLLTVAEANVTMYRSCQFLPLFTAAGMLLLYTAFTGGRRKKWAQPVALCLAFVLVYNQAECMTRSFYVDYRKYENTKEVLTQIAYEIEKEYGTELPVVFTGHYETPHELLEDYYVDYSSWQYRWIAAITDPVDVHLKEKYFSPYGYSFIGNANYAFIQWGFDAFDGTNREMIRFLELHGHSFRTVTDEAVLEEARTLGEELPRWPEEGSVSARDGYILIHM